MARYEVRLIGAKLGEVPAVDIAKLLLNVQKAIARAAGASAGREVKSTGRWGRMLEDATRLRLVGLRRGSVVAELQLPEDQPRDDEFPFELEKLGDKGWQLVLSAIVNAEDASPDVVYRLARLGEDLGVGERYTAIEFGTAGSKVENRTRLDGRAREALEAVVQANRVRPAPPNAVAGVLVEADFERKTAHVRTPLGDRVEVVFEEELADDIQEALRQRSEFEGDVSYDPATATAMSVRLRRVVRTEQLLLGTEAAAFWESPSAAELIEREGKAPVMSFDQVRASPMTDDDFVNFLRVVQP